MLVLYAFEVCKQFNFKPFSNLRVMSKTKLEAYDTVNNGVKVQMSGYLENTAPSFSNWMFRKAVMYCLVPRIGRVDSLMPKDWNFMVHLRRGIPVNIDNVIFECMATCVNDNNKALPFAHIISGLVWMYEEECIPLSEMDNWSTQIVGANSTKSMGFHYVNGEFVKIPTKSDIVAALKGNVKAHMIDTAAGFKLRRVKRERDAGTEAEPFTPKNA